MKYNITRGLMILVLAITIASCSSSRKQPSRSGRVIIIEDGRRGRVETARKDNGLHKGWYKNPNNPHHPRTTNPGHTKHKGNSGKGNSGKGNKGKGNKGIGK